MESISTDTIQKASAPVPFPTDSICLLEGKWEAADSFEICVPAVHTMPYTPLDKDKDAAINLAFTVVFLIIFAFVRLRSKDLLSNLLQMTIKRKKALSVQNEGIGAYPVCYLLGLCLSFSVLSVGLSYVTTQEFLSAFTAYVFGGLLAYHFCMLSIIALLGWTFNAKHAAREFMTNLWCFHINAGLLVSPFVIALFFVQDYMVLPLLKVIGCELALLMIVKLIRWFEIFFVYKVSILYMILYLCALELIPLLSLYKVVV